MTSLRSFLLIYTVQSPVTSNAIIMILKDLFAEHGIPERLTSDNGGHYTSKSFEKCTNDWNINHITSSPYHSQRNGFAERTIQSIKQIMKKTDDLYLSLLLLRSTPIQNSTKSPAELLYDRKISTLLPSITKPNHQQVETLIKNESTSRRYYDNNNPRSLPLLDPSTQVRYRDPTTKTWKQATIVRPIEAPRSYDLQTAEGTVIRRNRRYLRPTPDVIAVDAGPDTTPSTPDTPTIL